MQESSIARQPIDQPLTSSLVSRITLEHVLWAVLLAAALVLRLWNLGQFPLNNTEAVPSLSAMNIAVGVEVTAANPLLAAMQSLVFSIFGTSDFSARFPTAVAGALLCLIPMLLRNQLGRLQALVAGCLLLISPTAWFVSRQADNTLIAWLLAALVLSFVLRKTPALPAIAFGMLLSNGQDAIYPAIVLSISIIVIIYTGAAERPTAQQMIRNAVISAVAIVISASGLLLRPVGIGEALNGAAAWYSAISAPGALGVWRILIGLAIYDWLLIFTAVIGAAVLITSKRLCTIHAVSGIWIGLGLTFVAINRSRGADDLIPLVIGCAILAAAVSDAYVRSIRQINNPLVTAEAVVFVIAIVMFVYSYHAFTMYAAQRQMYWLVGVLLGLFVVAALGIVATLTLHPASAIRNIGAALGVCLLFYSISSGYRLTMQPTTQPAEAYIAESLADGLPDLIEAMKQESTRLIGDPHSIAISVSSTAPPSLRWALRDMVKATYDNKPESKQALLTPMLYQPTSADPYIGSLFAVSSRAELGGLRCSPAVTATDQLDCAPLARWLAFRKSSEIIHTSWILWIADGESGDTNNSPFRIPEPQNRWE